MLEFLRNRRSVREYRDEVIEPDIIDKLKEAVLLSPSSRNLEPWRFLFVTDKNIIQLLSRSKPVGAGFVKEAALAVVVCADQNISDVWIEDCSIASIILQFAGQSVGLGSCWVQIRGREYDSKLSSEEYLRSIFKLPENIRVESIIAFGWPVRNSRGRVSGKIPDYGKIKNSY